MLLRIFVDSSDDQLIQKYKESSIKHNNKVLNAMNMIESSQRHIDAGFDLFVPCDIYTNADAYAETKEDIIEQPQYQYKVNHRVVCSASMITSGGKQFNTGYYLYPRSSISKTNIRLANSVGIIDSGYRGHLIGVFDNHNSSSMSSSTSNSSRIISAYDRVLQICAPGLVPILVELVENVGSLGVTDRGNNGFGSSGM
jgi:dUTP pyrophosphatase